MRPSEQSKRLRRKVVLSAVLGIAVAVAALGIEPKDSPSYLDSKEFFKPELYISSSQEPIEKILPRLPNRAVWQSYLSVQEKSATGVRGPMMPKAFIDPRSGAATSLIGAFPLLPGRGVGNHIKLMDMAASLGRPVRKVDPQTVADLVLAFVRANADLLGVDTTQLGNVQAAEVNPELWQVSIPQTYQGIEVRYGRVAASINNGNLVLIGTETWGPVRGLDRKPKLSGAEALAAGFAYAGGASAMDEMLRQPALEIIPVSAQAGPFTGPVGTGYRHRLAWTFVFRRLPDDAAWEVIVDAHSGEVLAFQDTNQYANQQVTGGVYPLSNTEICPNTATCGTMQTGTPMPFADTGLASPNNFTNSAGIFDWTGGTVTTTLTGRYVDIVDSCGAVSNSSTTGSLGLGGTNGQHDCTAAGGSTGNTSASRTAYYEVNKLAEMARGWLPTNTWLQSRLTTNVNINQTCNAFWGGGS